MDVSIREYGLLSARGVVNGLDHQVVPEAAYQELRTFALENTGRESGSQLLRLMSRRGIECVQACNYVGLIETSDGCRIEILPKTSNHSEDPTKAKDLLWRMLHTVSDLSASESGAASLNTLNHDWLEVLIEWVLSEVSRLVRRGICSSYTRRVEQSRFLKGQLQVSRQLRLPPGKHDRFCVSYDQYLPDRAENRLIHSALIKLSRWTQLPKNQRLCRELLFMFAGIPDSKNIKADLGLWSDRRELAHYQPVHPWVKLILADESPVFSAGQWKGISLLFPMEQLFEEYVAKKLVSQLGAGYYLKTQACSKHLVQHQGKNWFQLKPDLLILQGSRFVSVLDTKWKLIDEAASDGSTKYNIKQSDMYQLFAYGEKYLGGEGDLFLIYPAHDGFVEPLPVFEFNDRLRLWAVPFDLANDVVVEGEWQQQSEWIKQILLDVA